MLKYTQMYNHNNHKDPDLLLKQLQEFINSSKKPISLLANLSALLKQYYPETNWIGFYLLKDEVLYLGPFQGKSACIEIPIGKGVCGSAVLARKAINVGNVKEIANHIACDSESVSELVVPIIKDNLVIGVLDLDAPFENYFTKADEELLTEFVEILADNLNILI